MSCAVARDRTACLAGLGATGFSADPEAICCEAAQDATSSSADRAPTAGANRRRCGRRPA